MERVSGPADQPAAFNEMPDRPIGSTRLLQQNLPRPDITDPASHVGFVPTSRHRPIYAMRVSKKKSASGLTNEFIATCSEFTCSPCCLTYSYAACSRSRSG